MSNAQVSPISRSVESPPKKRARLATPPKHHKNSLAAIPSRIIDPTYGQSRAFPGLDDDSTQSTEQLFYGPAEDGLEYLLMVRSEARSVPNLLVAPSKSDSILQAGEVSGSRAPVSRTRDSSFYWDGTYASICTDKAPSDLSSVVADSRRKDEATPQGLFSLSLLKRFDNLRRDLHRGSPSTALSVSIPGSIRSWGDHIASTPPSPYFVGRLEQPQILLALRALEDIFSLPHLSSLPFKTYRHIGAWAISLLAVCRDVGDMDSEDVGVVRVLGKSATTELRRLEAFGVSVFRSPQAVDKDVSMAEDEFPRRRLVPDRNTSSPSSTGSQNDSGLLSPNHQSDGSEGSQHEMNEVEGDGGRGLMQARQRLLTALKGNNLGHGDGAYNPPELETPTKQPKLTAPQCPTDSCAENPEQGEKNDDEQRAGNPGIEENKVIGAGLGFRDEQQQQQQEQEKEEEEEEEEEGGEEGEIEKEEEEEEDDSEWKNGGAAVAIRALYESVIVLVGGRYGQKDLLEAIAPW